MNFIRFGYIIIIMGLLISCEKAETKKDISGTWVQNGYGRIIQIKDSTYTYFNTSQSSCIPLVSGKLKDRFKVIRQQGDTLVLNPGGIVDYNFYRTEKLPILCMNKETKTNDDPLINFNEFWNTFKNNYAFFEQRNINWDSIYKVYEPKIKNVSSNKKFFGYLKEITDKFQDGHIRLDVPDSLREETSSELPAKNVITKEKIQADIVDTYVRDYKSYNNGVIGWGILAESNIGYIQISDMNDFANYVSNKNISEKEFKEQFDAIASDKSALQLFDDEIAGVDYIMPKVLEDLGATDSLILDLRFNGGGYETVALKLLSYFVATEKHILSVSAKTASGKMPMQKYNLEPNEISYVGNIFILTSQATASAAEIFALGAQRYPEKFKSFGAATNGIFSEILWKRLPNGWEYSMSNEIYTDPEGNVLEARGIPVDVEMGYPSSRIEFYESFYSESQFIDETIKKIIEIEKSR